MREETAIAARLSRLPAAEPLNDVWALVRARTRPRESMLPGWLVGANQWYRRAAATALVACVVVAGVLAFRSPAVSPEQVVEQVKPPSAVAVQWSDDPLGHENDVMMSYLSNM